MNKAIGGKDMVDIDPLFCFCVEIEQAAFDLQYAFGKMFLPVIKILLSPFQRFVK